MPLYEYRCQDCGHEFAESHGLNDPIPECPECESEDIQRLITSAPTIARGMLTPAGDGHKASAQELRNKWREETPKLRKKLRDKLGDEAVKDIPSLNANFDD